MNNVILLDEIKEYLASMQTGIKKVQRGVSTSATKITIDAVDMSKAFVVSTSKGSAGYVAARGSSGQTMYMMRDFAAYPYITIDGQSGFGVSSVLTNNTLKMQQNISLSGGTTDLTTRQYSAKLISSTQIQTDGACEWQVIEFM